MSLNLRVLLAASAILSSFFGLAGATLDQLYRESAEQALKEQLQGYVYQLIAVASLDKEGHLTMPDNVPDHRFSNISSGVYAQVASNERDWLWRSASMKRLKLDLPQRLPRMEQLGEKLIGPYGEQLYSYSYGVVWSDVKEPGQAYTFTVVQDLDEFNAALSAFRQNLWGTLGGVAILLLAVQGIILRWGLLPLKHAADELSAIEAGSQNRLKGKFPPELEGLTSNINALLAHQHEHLERYRKTLGDLAHSLKTPLAILQSAVENKNEKQDLSTVIEEQVERMNQITGYQLQRAAASGWTILTAPIMVNELIGKVMNGLQKVYAEKMIETNYKSMKPVEYHGDEGDLMEIVGNIADNAFKWCKKRVYISAENIVRSQDNQWDLMISVEDDGPGVSPDMVDYVMKRGRRADNDIPGHGIGLSIVSDIVRVYGGVMEIDKSRWGGAKVNIWLPGYLPQTIQSTSD
jgi:two-component system sensor histidine kinase PhoQ